MPPRRGLTLNAVSPRASAAALVDLLDRSKNRFTSEDCVAKRSALLALAGQPLLDPALLLRFHEALCFLRAHPDDAHLLALVEDALERFGTRVQIARSMGRPNVSEALEETGIARTTIYCPLSFPAACWLAGRFPDAAELDWDAETDGRLAAILPFLIALTDEEALVDVGVSYRAWLAAAKGTDARSDLAWILDRLGRAPMPAKTRQALYDGLGLRIRWDLGESPASRTLAKIPTPRVFFHRHALLRYRGPLTRRLPGPRVAVRLLAPAESVAVLDAARASVAVRYREIHGFNFADPADALMADVGRGVQIAWFGLLSDHRLPLRAHYGYLVLKNGVPIGYGDASLLCDWAEVAFNIFETFRSGESAFAFVRLLAFLYQHFRVRTFHLAPYQIGYENDEAIQSGAFWFYYKLGFRSKRADLRRLSAEERRHIARDPAYRSSREILERLCQGGMVMNVGRGADPLGRAFDVQRVGCRAARAAQETGGNLASMLAQSLGVIRWRTWPRSERLAFERLAPVLSAVPDLSSWPRREHRALVDIIRAKGGPREADYLRRTQAHARLRDSLLRLSAPGPV